MTALMIIVTILMVFCFVICTINRHEIAAVAWGIAIAGWMWNFIVMASIIKEWGG